MHIAALSFSQVLCACQCGPMFKALLRLYFFVSSFFPQESANFSSNNITALTFSKNLHVAKLQIIILLLAQSNLVPHNSDPLALDCAPSAEVGFFRNCTKTASSGHFRANFNCHVTDHWGPNVFNSNCRV